MSRARCQTWRAPRSFAGLDQAQGPAASRRRSSRPSRPDSLRVGSSPTTCVRDPRSCYALNPGLELGVCDIPVHRPKHARAAAATHRGDPKTSPPRIAARRRRKDPLDGRADSGHRRGPARRRSEDHARSLCRDPSPGRRSGAHWGGISRSAPPGCRWLRRQASSARTVRPSSAPVGVRRHRRTTAFSTRRWSSGAYALATHQSRGAPSPARSLCHSVKGLASLAACRAMPHGDVSIKTIGDARRSPCDACDSLRAGREPAEGRTHVPVPKLSVRCSSARAQAPPAHDRRLGTRLLPPVSSRRTSPSLQRR